MSNNVPTGKTKSQGWEIGVRRTLPISDERLWALLMTQPGLGYWLGHGVEPEFKKGMTFKTQEGTTGEIRSYSEGSLIRMRWQPHDAALASTLQIRVNPAKKGAALSFHHEKLLDADQREAMRAHWSGVIDKLEHLVKG